MFRSGGSEYAINGNSCRLLDVQELLSDSGIGREMHVIVGQGQLDTILHATPEDRRGFIEEAAGVLKHRKRKEKALRKLDATDGNLTRLSDLLTEIRRQLKPLGRQAEVARRAATVQADARDARARLLADDLVTARTALEQEMADESILVTRREQVEAEMARAREHEAGLEAALREDLPALAPGAGDLVRPVRAARAAARHPVPGRRAGPQRSRPPRRPRSRSGRDPEQLEAEAEQVREQEQRIAAEVEANRTALEQAVGARIGRRGRRRRGGPPGRGPPARRRRPARGARPAARAGQRAEVARRRRRRRGRAARPWPARRRWPAPSAPSATSPPSRPRSPGSTPARRGSTPSTRPPSAALDDIEERLAKARDEALAGRPRPDRARRAQGRAGDGPEPQGRRRCAARRLRPGLRPARLGRRAAHRARRLRGRRRRGPRGGGRRGRGRRRRRRGRARSTTSRATTSAAPACCSAAAPAADRDWPGLPATAAYAVDVVDCPDQLRPALTRLLARVAVVDDLDRGARAGRATCPTSPR